MYCVQLFPLVKCSHHRNARYRYIKVFFITIVRSFRLCSLYGMFLSIGCFPLQCYDECIVDLVIDRLLDVQQMQGERERIRTCWYSSQKS